MGAGRPGRRDRARPGGQDGADLGHPLRGRDEEERLHDHELPAPAQRRAEHALLRKHRGGRRHRALLRFEWHGEDDPLGRPGAQVGRRRRARLDRRRGLQHRGRLLCQVHQAEPGERAADLGRDPFRKRARERRPRAGAGGRLQRRLAHREYALRLPGGAHRRGGHPGPGGPPEQHLLLDMRRARRAAAHLAPHAGAGDVPLPERLHREGGGHRGRRHRAATHVQHVLRGPVPAAAPQGLRRAARREEEAARRPGVAGEHRMDWRRLRGRQPDGAGTHPGAHPRGARRRADSNSRRGSTRTSQSSCSVQPGGELLQPSKSSGL
jgi:hypothetical protein